jgi:hypothetical protein
MTYKFKRESEEGLIVVIEEIDYRFELKMILERMKTV